MVGEMRASMKKVKARSKQAGNALNCCATITSPIGELLLVADDSALVGLYFSGCDHVPEASGQWERRARHPILQEAAKQLQEYFSESRQSFSVPLRLEGTDFQQKVWQEIARVPYGETVTYTELAKRAGAPSAVRATGTATGRNPLAIIVPCHRVVGKNGTLRGFAGGLETKEQLLRREKGFRLAQR